MLDTRDIFERFGFMKEDRQKWEPYWKDISKVILPRRSFWDDEDSGGKQPETKLFDATAQESLQIHADGVMGYSVSPSFKFFKLKMADDQKTRSPYAADWLEEVENPIYSEFNRSDFYGEYNQFLVDYSGFGTGCLFVEDNEEEEKTIFSCRHLKEIYIAENRYGKVDTVFRKFKVPIRTMVQQFGKDTISTSWKTIYENNPYQRVTVLHSVLPRGTEGMGRRDKPFASMYYNFDEQVQLDEGGYDEMPYLVGRYRKSSNETYGRGPGGDALTDALMANQMAKTLLMGGEKSVNPPLNVPEAQKGRERIVPNGYNYYNQTSGKIEAINLGSNMPYGYQELERKQTAIRNKFSVNFFLMLENLERTGQMTATEVMERQSEKAAVLGAMIGRMNSEVLSPLIDRVFSILQRRMMIPPPPQGLAQEGGRVDIEYMGPLAQAQRRFNQNQGVNATLGLISAMVEIEGKAAQFSSTSIDNFNMDELAYAGANASGAPQKTIREKPEIDELRAARAQAQKAQQGQAVALEQQKMLAGNADKLNQPVVPGSMMDNVTGGKA